MRKNAAEVPDKEACKGCGKVVNNRTGVCRACQRKHSNSVCNLCGRPIQSFADTLCPLCKKMIVRREKSL